MSRYDSEQYYSNISLCADNNAQAVLLIEQFLYADIITYKAVYMQTVVLIEKFTLREYDS